MNRIFLIAWKNLKRKVSRTLLLAGSAGLTAFILFASYFFVHSMERSIEASSSRLGADLLVVPKGYGSQAGDLIISGTATPFYMDQEVLGKIRSIPEVELAAAQVYLQTVSTVCCRTEGDFPIVAFDPASDFTLKHWMADKKELGPYDILIGSAAGGDNFLFHYDNEYVEEWVTLFGKDFSVKGVMFPTGMGTDNTIFMHMEAARELNGKEGSGLEYPKDQISIVLVKVRPGMESLVKREMEKLQLDVDIVQGKGLQDMVNTQIFPVKLLSYLMIVLVLVMSSLQVATMFTALISERRKEIGMLRAMGATRGATYRLLLLEAGMASLIGASIGSIMSAAGLYDNRILIMQVLQLPLLFPDWVSGLMIGLITTAVTVGISVLAAFFPIRSTIKMEPYEAIREGE
ncbi:FtsX-like permease family protein [Ammoniphilus sp. CFH 90114]|uniref:ABC transporter permease n=1 Tax=Ammoniphilus sp. CFH 90114 TaxID=2493665 RepID=UPI00100DCE09|nr:FtsX-like permease family protein [Ammoniphilus sp. CFH 90114]RXT14710.1 FtsX-like permease family protein [Ammoniphilus sp. CFH 90114]